MFRMDFVIQNLIDLPCGDMMFSSHSIRRIATFVTEFGGRHQGLEPFRTLLTMAYYICSSNISHEGGEYFLPNNLGKNQNG